MSVPDAGGPDNKDKYTGTLALYTNAGTASVVPLTIEKVAQSASDRTPAKPLVSSTSVTKYTDSDDEVTLWVPIAAVPKGKTLSLEPDQSVGAVTGGGKSASVSYVKLDTNDDMAKVGLHVAGLEPGKYDGKVDLDAEGTAGDVAVAMTVKEPWQKAVALILVGVLFAFITQWLLGPELSRRRLRLNVDGLQTRLVEALRKFRAVQENPWSRAEFTISKKATELKQRIEDKTDGSWIQVDQAVVDSLNSEIETAGVQIDNNLPALAKKLVALDTLLSSQPSDNKMPRRSGDDLSESEPALAHNASNLVKLPESAVDAFDETVAKSAEADTEISVMRELVGDEARIASLVSDLKIFDEKLPANDPRRAQLPPIEADLVSVWHQVWNAGTVRALGDYGMEISRIDTAVADLWPPMRDGERQPDRAKPDDQLETSPATLEAAITEAEDAGDLPSDDVSYASFDRSRRTRSPWLPPDDAEGRERVLSTYLLEVLGVILAGLVVVLAGVTALWIDKPFGSTWDHITAFTWGLVTPTAIATLGAALNKIGQTAAVRRGLERF
jgi:hypothetical protein